MSWWADAVIYQIYPRSFADSNGDGMGDLPGAIGKLDYLKRLGVDAIWLSPFYLSPQKDAGYDVADYRAVDPVFGTLEDVDALISGAHERGIRFIVDLVPNHTSDQHVWFQAALEAEPGSAERERYIFRDGKGPGGEEPPNNWQSVFGGRAWTRVAEPDGTPGQWYLHLFDASQPDLNWSNREVRDEMESVLRFWLDRGVDGFRVDVAHGLVKAEGLPDHDARVTMVGGEEAPSHDPMARSPYFDQDGVHEIYAEWRRVLDAYDGDRMMVAEAWVEPLERLFRYVRPGEMHQAFNFNFLVAGWDAVAAEESITESFAAAQAVGAPATWVLSNHDTVRHTSRYGLAVEPPHQHGIGPSDPQPDHALGTQRARASALLLFALPGSAYVYQGDELALPDHTSLPDEVRQDPAFFRTAGADYGRDGARIPLPWDADAPALGFGAGEPWLPQPPEYRALAASAQVGVPGSTFELYRELLALRHRYGWGRGTFAWHRDSNSEAGVLGFVVTTPEAVLEVFVNYSATAVSLAAVSNPTVQSRPGAVEGGLLAPNAAVWLVREASE